MAAQAEAVGPRDYDGGDDGGDDRGEDGRRSAWWQTAVLALAVFLAAALPRLVDLGRFITWDEPFWTHAALHFHRELDGQDWDGTYLIGQPGVVTMALGSLALALDGTAQGPAAREAILEAGQGRYREDDPARMRLLATTLRRIVPVIALATSLAVVAAWWGLRRLWGEAAAYPYSKPSAAFSDSGLLWISNGASAPVRFWIGA